MTKRLVLSYLTIAAVVLCVLEIPFGIVFARAERRNLVAELKHDALALAAITEETLAGNARDDVQGVVRAYQANTDGRVIVTDKKGTLVADSSVPKVGRGIYGTRPEIAAALRGKEVHGARHSDTLDTDLLYVTVPVASSGKVVGAVRITYTPTEVDARVRRGWLALAGIGLAVLAVTTIVSILLARSVTGPLRRLRAAAGRLAEGDLDARARLDVGPPEVRALGAAFDSMAARLAQLVHAQEALVADASHELRTPLTALRLRLENAEARARGKSLKEDLGAALGEAARLNVLVDGLLALARAEGDVPAPRNVDLADVIASRQQAWEAVAKERGVELRAAPSPVDAVATRSYLEQSLDNLISNALDVSPEGGVIEVRAMAENGCVEVHVTDQGPGMTAEQRARAADRFWRAGGAEHKGFGLGLAIVQRLAKLDGGELELREAQSGGLDAVLKLHSR